MISEFVGVVVSTSDEKKAPPYVERLQKEHCIDAGYRDVVDE